jgi:hypothetical protein
MEDLRLPVLAGPLPFLAPASGSFPREYLEGLVLGRPPAGPARFLKSLRGIAIGPEDRIHVLGDGMVKVFEAWGGFLREWPAPPGAACLAVAKGGRLYFGAPGRVEVQEAGGASAGGFPAGGPSRPAEITSIKALETQVLVGDATARLIRIHDLAGKALGEIGARTKTGCFILPNKSLDFGVGPDGVVHAGDTGRHQVSSWALDGAPRGAFGKYGLKRPEDFVGCCNPVNIAVGPTGEIVTAEKVVPRLKVFSPAGELLAVIGPGPFDPACTSIPVAVDSKGRIVAADPVRREVRIFLWEPPAGGGAAAPKEEPGRS